jgi:hypothetical protein
MMRREILLEGEIGWGGRIRTSAWRNQNPLPYRLATPQSWPGVPFGIGQGGEQMKNDLKAQGIAFSLADTPWGGYISPRFWGLWRL